jgi:hypothetical protein
MKEFIYLEQESKKELCKIHDVDMDYLDLALKFECDEKDDLAESIRISAIYLYGAPYYRKTYPAFVPAYTLENHPAYDDDISGVLDQMKDTLVALERQMKKLIEVGKGAKS